jgi:hypothetical protein
MLWESSGPEFIFKLITSVRYSNSQSSELCSMYLLFKLKRINLQLWQNEVVSEFP